MKSFRWLTGVYINFSNICHGSDAVESAQKEIALWFKPEELVAWEACNRDWVYE